MALARVPLTLVPLTLVPLALVPLTLVALTLVALVVGLPLPPHPLRDDVAIAHGKQDLDLVQLVPLGVGALPLRDGEKLLETCAGGIGRLLRFVHAAIIACSIPEGRAAAPPW
jgi:hypothetical protein